jgi:hypothetical protein
MVEPNGDFIPKDMAVGRRIISRNQYCEQTNNLRVAWWHPKKLPSRVSSGKKCITNWKEILHQNGT